MKFKLNECYSSKITHSVNVIIDNPNKELKRIHEDVGSDVRSSHMKASHCGTQGLSKRLFEIRNTSVFNVYVHLNILPVA